MNEYEYLGWLNKTGHYHNRSGLAAYESTDDCGTCDGLMCDVCRDMYTVERLEDNKIIYYGPDKEKAIELAGYNFVKRYERG